MLIWQVFLPEIMWKHKLVPVHHIRAEFLAHPMHIQTSQRQNLPGNRTLDRPMANMARNLLKKNMCTQNPEIFTQKTQKRKLLRIT